VGYHLATMVTIKVPPVKPNTERINVSLKSGRKLFVQSALLLLTFGVLYYPLDLTRVAETTPPTPLHSNKNLPNFHSVHTYLLRGGAPSLPGLDELKRLGVKTIIDLRRNEQRIDVERQYAEKLGFNYVSIPMGDFIPSLEKQNQYLRVVQQAKDDPSKSPVFLHCSHGSDRTSFLVAIWRVKNDHWTIAQAVCEMLNSGFLIHKLKKDDQSLPIFE